MVPPHGNSTSLRKVLVLYLALFFFTSMFVCAYTEVQPQRNDFFGRRTMVELEDEDHQPIIKKKTSISSSLSTQNQTKLLKTTTGSSKNQTKLLKTTTGSSNNQTKLLKTTTSSSNNQTKLMKGTTVGAAKNQTVTKLLKLPTDSAKNKTKLTKPTSDSSEDKVIIKSQLKKLNSTSKSSNSSLKNSTLIVNKSSDLSKTSSAKNKTAKAANSKKTKSSLDKDLSIQLKSKIPDKKQISEKKPKSEKAPKQTLPSWVDQEGDDEDLVSEFRALPSKFQETLLPDLQRISKTSKVYLTKANREITRGFNPIVGKKYAPTVAPIVSSAFILIPLVLVSLLFNRIKAYFCLQKILIFIQIYLCIYFSMLCLSSLVTGLEPLNFFYVTSQSTYVCLQVLQTLAYVLYLLLLLMYLILVFSTESGMATKILGLGQTFVGFFVGLHYYMTVFRRAVLHQPPKTSWRVHAIYATCFLVICLVTRADRRKKTYSQGGEDGNKTS